MTAYNIDRKKRTAYKIIFTGSKRLHTKSYLQEAKDCIQNHIYRKQKTAYKIIFTGSKRLHKKVVEKKSTAYLAFFVGKDYTQNHIYR